jgi:arylsulfatase A-like enzyme
LRDGTWKLILQADVALKTDVQLYDLSADPGETTNLAEKLPERVEAMRAKLEELIRRGRSTPGSDQKNDVRVVRYPKKATSGEIPESR